jgi:hypothetical protein
MASQPQKTFSVLEFHSAKSVITVQWGFRRKLYKKVHVRIQYERGIIEFKTPVASAKRKVQAGRVPVKKHENII